MTANNQANTNFNDNLNGDLGKNLVTKEYLLSVYPDLEPSLGISPELWVWGDASNSRLARNTDVTDPPTPTTTFVGGSNWKQISCNNSTGAAIKTDGTLWTWGANPGDNSVNKLTPVTTFAGGTNWKQVSCGVQHVAAVKTDGTLWIWGDNTSGSLGTNQLNTTDPVLGTNIFFNSNTPVTTFAGGTDWESVACGYRQTIAIKRNGTLWTWGENLSGKLGVGPFLADKVLTPVTTFAGGTNWADTPTTNPEDLYTISGGGTVCAALKSDGTAWIWGLGDQYGSLGINVRNALIKTPVTTFAGGTNWRTISCTKQASHAMGIKTDGTLWIFGGQHNTYTTQLSGLYTYTPMQIISGGTWKQVSAGANGSLAIKTDGTLWGWGDPFYGKLGNGQASTSLIYRTTPITTFAGGTNWRTVDVSLRTSAAIKTDGTLWVWGSNEFYAPLGIGSSVNFRYSTPITTFAGGTDWKQVSCGSVSMSAIKTDGTLWSWGQGFSVGNGSQSGQYNLTPVTTFAGGTDWKQVSCGTDHTAAIKTDGTLWVWGNNANGQLGNDSFSSTSTPITTFAGGTSWTQVSCGDAVTIALFNDTINRRIYLFGSKKYSAIGNNYPIQYWYDTFATPTVAILTPVTTFAGGTNWKYVSAGYSIASAIKTNGTLWTWASDNLLSSLGNNNIIKPPYTPVTTFAGGTDWKQSSCYGYVSSIAAIKTDGTLWTWGHNTYNHLGNGGATTAVALTPITTFRGGSDWKQVSVGGFSVSAIKSDGSLWTWGFSSASGVTGGGGTNAPATVAGGGFNWKSVSTGYQSVFATKSVDYI